MGEVKFEWIKEKSKFKKEEGSKNWFNLKV